MKRLRELLLKWDEGCISGDEAQELKTLLQHPEQRREMVEEFLLTGEITEFLREEKTISETSEYKQNTLKTSSRRIVRTHKRKKWKPRIVWITAAACLLIAAGAFLYNVYEMGKGTLIKAKLVKMKGTITIDRGGDNIPASEHTLLFSGDRIETGNKAEAHVIYTDEKTSIYIAEKTGIEFSDEQGIKKITVEQGTINCSMAPQTADKNARIFTPHAEIKIIGTEFTLTVNREKGTCIDVAEGSVMVTDVSTGESAEVSEGFHVSVKGKERVSRSRGTPGNVVRTIILDDYYRSVAFDGTVLWMSRSRSSKTLFKIDPETGKTIGSLKTDVTCRGLDWDGKYLWTVDGSSVHAIDCNTGKAVKTFNAPRDNYNNTAHGIAAGSGVLWVASSSAVFLLDRENGRVFKSIKCNTGINVVGITYLRNSIWTRAYKAEYKRETKKWIKTYGMCKIDPATGDMLLFADIPGDWKAGCAHGLSNTDDTRIWILNSVEKKAYLVETGEEPIEYLKKKSGSSALLSLPKHIDRDEFWSTRTGFTKGGIIAREDFKDKAAFIKAWACQTVNSADTLVLDRKVPEDTVRITELEIGNIRKPVLTMDSRKVRDKHYRIFRELPKNIPAYSVKGRILCRKPYMDPNENIEGNITLAGVNISKDAKSRMRYILKDQQEFFSGKIGEWFSYSAEAMKVKDGAGRTFIDQRLFVNSQLVLWTRVYTGRKTCSLNLCYAVKNAVIYLDEISIFVLTRLQKAKKRSKETGNPHTTYQSRSHSVLK